LVGYFVFFPFETLFFLKICTKILYIVFAEVGIMDFFDTQDEMLILWVHKPSSKECYKCINLGHNQAIFLGIGNLPFWVDEYI